MLMQPNSAHATTDGLQVAGRAEQLAFYILVGIAVPGVIWSTLRGISLADESIRATLIGLLIANCGCWYVMGALRRYARARLLSYVLPVSLGLFGLVLVVSSLARVSLSFSLFFPCFLASILICYLATVRSRHVSPDVKHFLAPAGKAHELVGRYGFEELQTSAQLETLIDNSMISGSVIADLHFDHPSEWERLFAKAALAGIPVYHYRLIEEALSGEVRIEHLRENDLGSLIPNLPYMSAKRAIDIFASIVLAPVVLIVGAIIVVAIKLDSSGSAFFFQERSGFRGQSFRMVKFRTMSETSVAKDQEEKREQSITQDADSRITKVGKFLRKSRLDELPQIWNVFIGDMSWIGPRPEAEELAEWYQGEIPFYSYRHIVRPGISGWAQVNQGHVASVDEVATKLRFDFYYVKNLSLWLDALIALKTLRVIVQGIGAK